MRQVIYKTTNNEKVTFNTNLTTFVLDQEDPYGIEYRKPCSSNLSENEINEWWNYVDQLLIENPVNNFHSVWKIVEGGIIYGYIN